MESFKENKRPLLAEEIDIPIDIVKEILELLPLKSLVRFRCASKQWLSMINEIIHQRSDEKVSHISQSIASLHAKMDALSLSPDLSILVAQLKGSMYRMINLVHFGGWEEDIDRIVYIDRLVPNVDRLHVVIDGLAPPAPK